MKRTKTVALVVAGIFLLGACGSGVALDKQSTAHETCVYEQKYHKFSGISYGERVLIACTPNPDVGVK